MVILNGLTPRFNDHIVAFDAFRNENNLFMLGHFKSRVLQEEQRSGIRGERPPKDSILSVLV